MLSCYLLWGRPQRNYADPDESMFCIRDLTKRGLSKVDQAFEPLGRAPVVHHANNRTAVLQIGDPHSGPKGEKPRSAGLLGMIKDRATGCSLFDTAIGAAIPGGGSKKHGFGDRRGESSHRNGNTRKNGLRGHHEIL